MENIGEIIQDLRKKRNLTQQELADEVNCTRQYIGYVENNERTLKHEYYTPISNILGFNLHSYSKNLHKYNRLKHYSLSYSLIDLVNSADYYGLDKLLSNEIIEEEFDYGTPFLLKNYCTALVLQKNHNNYEEAENILLDILGVADRKDLEMFRPDFHEDERYYSCILLLAKVLFQQQEIQTAKTLVENTLNFIDTYFINDNLELSYLNMDFRVFYISLLTTYSCILFDTHEYQDVVMICEKAQQFIIDSNMHYNIEQILEAKVYALYKLDDLKAAQETYYDFKSVCKLKKKLSYLASVNNTIKNNFSLINTSE